MDADFREASFSSCAVHNIQLQQFLEKQRSSSLLKGDSSMTEGSGGQPSGSGLLELKFVNSAIKNLSLDKTEENYVLSVQGNYKR